MNIAIMADIHGNHIALEACIGEARKLGAEESSRYLDNVIVEYPVGIFVSGIAYKFRICYYNTDLSDKLLGSPQAGRISRHFWEFFHERTYPRADAPPRIRSSLYIR